MDVGSNDPRHFNNTFYFYKLGWRGINIEPNKRKLNQFRLLRPGDLNLNLGIAQKIGIANFYSFEEDTLSTFSKEVSEKYQNMGHTLKKVGQVELQSLCSVFSNYLKPSQEIDFLTIDTEGYDLEVLKSNDWDKYRPHYIVVESLEYERENTGKKLNHIFNTYMNDIGYEIVADTFINSIYKDKKLN